MTNDGGGEWTDAFSAVEAWWREAGVDCGFEDHPRDWLAPLAGAAQPSASVEPAAAQPAGKDPGPPAIGGDPSRWPTDLSSFGEWWLAEPTLGVAGDGRRILPRGPRGAALMIVVAQPEGEDRDRLLSGAQGRLLGNLLAVLGLAVDECYLASVLPAHVGLIDWELLAARGMAAVLSHHVALAAPGKLLVLGREINSALLEHGSSQEHPYSKYLAHESPRLPLACAASLQGLLDRPARKAGVWRTLLDWTGS